MLDETVRILRSRAKSVAATGSAAIDVATGALDAAFMRAPDDGPWHSAVFVLLVRAAGGIATDCGSGIVLFSNNRLHDDVLASLTGVPT